MVTYLCPECRAYMVPVSSRSMPATIHYRCVGCGYTSKTEQVKDYVLELPRELWNDDGKGADTCMNVFHCGCRAVVWCNDFSFSDYEEEGDGIYQVLTCTHCGAEITYRIPFDDDDEPAETAH